MSRRKDSNKYRAINRYGIFLIWAVIITLLMALFIVIGGNENVIEGITFDYVEDPSKTLTIESVSGSEFETEFTTNENSEFNFGKSTSAYWIRFRITEQVAENMAYISIYNPTIAEATLYAPVSSAVGGGFQVSSFGWKQTRINAERFVYPVFSIVTYEVIDAYGYLRIWTPFSQKYSIMFLSQSDYSGLLFGLYILGGIIIGVILTGILYNSIAYIELKNRHHMAYVVYSSLLLLYLINLMGIYAVIAPPNIAFIMSNTIGLSFMVMFGSLYFFKAFFETKERFKIQHKVLLFLQSLALFGLVMSFIENYLIKKAIFVNTFAHNLFAVVVIIMLIFAINIYRQGVLQARYFIIGWSLNLVSVLISSIRVAGYLPNNLITMNITLISIAIETVFISAALVEKVKSLTAENAITTQKIKAAELVAISNELAFLQAQIKPHFLFNSLNVIAAICLVNGEKARVLVMDLASFLRKSFDFDNSVRQVSLDDEMEFVQAYFRIEQARFGGKLQLIEEIQYEKTLMMPSLVLQPIVENAIRHGVLKSKNKGIIKVRGYLDEDEYVISVIDNGVGMTREKVLTIFEQSQPDHGIGLKNINARLKNYYGRGLSIESQLDKGTVVTIRIPHSSSTVEDSVNDKSNNS